MSLRLVRNYVNFPDISFTPSSEDSEFPATNLNDGLRSKVWRTTGVSSESVIVDLQTQEAVDSIAVFFRANQPVKLTGGATVTIQGNASPSFGSPLYSQTLTLDTDTLVMSHFLSTAESHRYWRLLLDDPGNPYGHFEVSQLVLGSAESFDGVEVGFKWSSVDASRSQRTAFGQKYSDVYPARRTVSFSVPVETYANFESLINFYELVGETESFMFSLDPLETAFDKDRFLMWGNFEKAFEATHLQGNYFTMPFEMEEQL